MGDVVLAGQWEQEVTWTNTEGVSVSGSDLTKIGSVGWDAGAISTQALLSGFGAVEFTADGYSDRVVGFDYSDAGPGHSDIAVGLHLTDGGRLYLFTDGQFTEDLLGDYSSGDRFRLALGAEGVRFYKNGTLLHTLPYSNIPPLLYPLRLQTTLYHPGAVVKNVAVWGSWEPMQYVAWTNAECVDVDGSTLTKRCGAGWNAGAVSDKALTSGDGGVEFIAEGISDRIVGFGLDDLGPGYEDIDFGIHLTDGGRIFIIEDGLPSDPQRGDYSEGDRFRIAIEAGVVRYYKNWTLLYERRQAVVYPLWVHASLYHPGAVVKNVAVWGLWEAQ